MWVELILYICVAMFLSDVGVWQLVSERAPTSHTPNDRISEVCPSLAGCRASGPLVEPGSSC